MDTNLNIPYVKKYDSNGVVSNPVTRSTPYSTIGNNRSERRTKETRFIGNGNNFHLSVNRTSKYIRKVQHIKASRVIESLVMGVAPVWKDVPANTINHYVLVKNK